MVAGIFITNITKEGVDKRAKKSGEALREVKLEGSVADGSIPIRSQTKVEDNTGASRSDCMDVFKGPDQRFFTTQETAVSQIGGGDDRHGGQQSFS